MINLIYTLAFTQVLTVVGILILGVWITMLQRKIKKMNQDTDLKRAIREYEMRWGE